MERKTEPSYKYYLVAGRNRDGVFCFDLSYSGETGDEGFPQICMDILTGIFENQWVKMWIGDPYNRGFLLPNGQRSLKKELFAEAMRRTWEERENVKGFVKKREKLLVISKGLEQSVLRSYLTRVPEEFHVCHAGFLGYSGNVRITGTYEEETAAEERSDWSVWAQYGEMQDDLEILMKDDIDPKWVRKMISEVCQSAGRELVYVDEI